MDCPGRVRSSLGESWPPFLGSALGLGESSFGLESFGLGDAALATGAPGAAAPEGTGRSAAWTAPRRRLAQFYSRVTYIVINMLTATK